MRKLLITACLFPLALFAGEPETLPLDQAPITTVDLNVGWANVQRAVTIPAGPARRIRLDKLEGWLIPSTVRGSGSSFVDAKGTVIPAKSYDLEEIKTAKTAIADKQQEIADLEAERELQQRTSKNLQQLIDWKTSSNPKATEEAPRTLTTAEIEAITKLNAQLAENLKQMLALQKTIREAKQAVADLQKEMEKQVAELPDNYGRVDLDLSASAEDVTITLHYQVTMATWYPVAEAVMTDDGLDIRYKAIVRQNTGGDWADVALTLTHGTIEPTWRKNYYTVKSAASTQAFHHSRSVLANARAAGVPSIWLNIPKATIPSNGILASLDGPVATPEVTRRWVLNAQTGDRAAASLILKNADPIGYPSVALRPGPLTQTHLPAIPGGDSLTVSLQPDSNLTVTRTPLPGSVVSSTATSGKKKPQTHRLGGYRLSVHNAYDTPRTVELYEPLNNRTFLGASPQAASASTHLHWTLTIPPKSSKSVTWTFRQ